MALSRAQKILRFFTSEKKFEEYMDESSRYKFDCEHCGRQSNIWGIGGICYKAYGIQTTLVKCPNCGRIAMRKIYKT